MPVRRSYVAHAAASSTAYVCPVDVELLYYIILYGKSLIAKRHFVKDLTAAVCRQANPALIEKRNRICPDRIPRCFGYVVGDDAFAGPNIVRAGSDSELVYGEQVKLEPHLRFPPVFENSFEWWRLSRMTARGGTRDSREVYFQNR